MINFNLEEMEMMVDLATLPKYENSSSLQERYEAFEKETNEMLAELKELKAKINNIQEFSDIIEDVKNDIENGGFEVEEMSLLNFVDIFSNKAKAI
ncbi:hypothetical protein [Clostridium perfringens]|uniref:hypothetical protein n=1 Tax=Clostridium perfringens TaxID=1502 RepID=UPI002ED30AEF|nr:hypothetical protein LMS42_014755 [Clostridium perfringens]